MSSACDASITNRDECSETAPSSAASPQEPADAEAFVSAQEEQQNRREKLLAIRAAIEQGDYDSDELLQSAVNIMLARLRESQSEEIR
jgi:C-terminal processing protease CtpA/Prc